MPLRADERRVARLLAALAFATAVAAFRPPGANPVVGATVLNAVNALVCLALVVAAIRRARHHRAEAPGWWGIAVGAVLQLAYQVWPIGAVLATGRLPGYPAWTEVLQVPALFAVALGLLLWAARRRSSLRSGLDGVLFGASLLFVLWAAAAHELVRHGPLTPLEQTIMLADLVLIAAGLGFVVHLATTVEMRLLGPLNLIAGALLAAGASGLSIATLSLRDRYYVGHPVDALVLLTVGLFLLAALAPGPAVAAAGAPPPRRPPAASLLPYIPVVASLFTAALLLSRPDAAGDTLLTALGIAIGFALVLRQQLALRDVEQLSHHLSEKVAERTRELARAQAALARAQRLEAVGRMAGGVARDFERLLHDLDEPVMVLADAVPAEHPDREAIDEIAGARERARRLTGQLLTFAQRQPVEPRVVDVNALLADFLPLLRRLAGKAVAIELRTAPGPAPVFADPTQIEQLLSNLTVNARDAMPEGGTLAIAVALAGDAPADDTGPAGPRVRIAVRDTGAGMDEATLAHIFEPFFTTKPAGQGTGLGLPTCYGIVNRAGGRIRVESTPGAGTTVTVDLPRAS